MKMKEIARDCVHCVHVGSSYYSTKGELFTDRAVIVSKD